MNFDSKQDRETLKRRFFDAVGDLFPQGAPVHRLHDVSVERGVWDEVKGQMVREGITSVIRNWIRSTKDSDGRRVYHSLPSFDSEGVQIDVYKPVALFDLNDYRTVLAACEKRIGEEVAVYLDLIAQAEERYGYVHPMPPEVRAYIELVTESAVRSAPKKAERKKNKRERKQQPEVKA